MEFKIVSFNPATAQIVVEVGDMRLALDLPVDDDGYVPEGDALETYVMGFIPPEVLRRQRVLAQHGGVRNAESIQRLVTAPAPQIQAGDISQTFLLDVNLTSL
jgi:hypothetical protein